MSSDTITPVKLVAIVLHGDDEILAPAFALLGDRFSPIDYRGPFFPFRSSDYYEAEMGPNLRRGMIAFSQLCHPGKLAASKLKCRELENHLAEAGRRRINIDVGYLDMFKLVLASFKGRTNKIYLQDGVWADMVLYFEKGDFRPFLWSFPDFASGIYNPSLIEIRNRYKVQLRAERKTE